MRIQAWESSEKQPRSLLEGGRAAAAMVIPMVVPAVVSMGTPANAFATEYLSVQQAPRALFAQADHFENKTLQFNAAQLQALQLRYGVAPRSAQWHVIEARAADKLLGWVVIDNVVGKFELITYAVAVQPDGRIAQVEILSYRESHGAEVRLPAWRQQFVGKGAQSEIKVGQDIVNISGATLSCTHVSEGVKRIVSVIDLARSGGLL